MEGKDQRFDCRTVHEKRAIYASIYAWLRRLPTEEEVRRVIRELSRRYQIDIAEFCEDLCMTWDELAALASDPLVTIGAHTVNHVMLKKVTEKAARTEMEMSRSVIAASLGVRPQHLAYPVGDPTSAGPREFQIAQELGFKTAVTTRPGVLFRQHRNHLTALPRISVNGEFQRMRYLRVLMSGAATVMWNGFRPVNAT
jgi:peptidoglycan/xylan/chitin deacetylase (PgdA/CDA1 family)